jgi:squalene synthase HpnC
LLVLLTKVDDDSITRTNVTDGVAGSGAGTLAAAEHVLAQIAAAAHQQNSSENFPVALRLVPQQPRRHLLRVYDFARFVDDVGDEADGDRLALLDLIDADVRKLQGGRPALAPVRGLQQLVRERRLCLDPLIDLIDANRMDQRVRSYARFDDLLDYCRLSAASIGRMVLSLAGHDTPEDLVLSDAICAGLQVLEHCQDVGEDARMGRVYLPADDLAAAGVTDADLIAETATPELRRVIALQVERSRELIIKGSPLIAHLHGWARLALTGYCAGGLATAARLRAIDYDVLARRTRPSKLRTLAEAVRLSIGAVTR